MVRNCLKDYRLLCTLLMGLSMPQLSFGAELKTDVKPAAQAARVWNLKEVDLLTVIHQVSEETGKNFIVDPQVKGRVTMVSNHALSPDELYQVFLSILHIHGYATVENANAINIVPMTQATSSAIPVESGRQISPNGTVIVKIIPVENVSVDELIKVLRPLVPKEGQILSYPPTNDLIIVDEGTNIEKITKIAATLDKPVEGKTEVVHLKRASAEDIVNTLTQLENARAQQSSDPLKLAADSRTNNVLISGARSDRLRLRGIISELDTAVDGQNGSTQVIYLKYIRAADLAPIVNDLINNYLEQSKKGGGTQPGVAGGYAGGYAGGAYGGASQQTQQRPSLSAASSGSGGGGGGGGMGGGGNSNGAQNSDLRQRDISPGPKSGSVGPAVQWEETTNSIIVTAPPAVMGTIRGVISKLDMRRAQVLVEVVIAEVSLSRAEQLGVEWNLVSNDVRFGTSFPSTATGFMTGAPSNAASIGGPTTATASASGGSSGGGTTTTTAISSGSGLTLGFFHNGNLRALVTALAQDNSSNILSTPNIVTLDNEDAQIKVGQQVPFATGETNNSNTNGVPFTSFASQDVGLNLILRPQITHSGAIKMYIEHDLSSIVAGSGATNPGNNPTTTDRYLTTNVMVDNGQILVLGGLIQNNWQDTVSKVPLLGDIPLIGNLFKRTNKSLVKNNLMIFIRPVVLRDTEDNLQVTSGKYNYMRQKQLSAEHDLVRPLTFNEGTALPTIDKDEKLPPPF
jgi:general secretion pathway protein D